MKATLIQKDGKQRVLDNLSEFPRGYGRFMTFTVDYRAVIIIPESTIEEVVVEYSDEEVAEYRSSLQVTKGRADA